MFKKYYIYYISKENQNASQIQVQPQKKSCKYSPPNTTPKNLVNIVFHTILKFHNAANMLIIISFYYKNTLYLIGKSPNNFKV